MAVTMPWWLLLIFLKFSFRVSPDAYNYQNPDQWQEDFPMCGGPMQSPIALSPNRLALSRTPKLEFAKGLTNGDVEVVNSGREIKLKMRPENRSEPLLRLTSFSKPMLGVYTFAQMHFHWGDQTVPTPEHHGSEHAIGQRFTDAEAHFVFYNSYYGSFRRAVKNFDGLLVIGIMLDATNDTQPLMFPTLGMENRLKEIATPGKKLKLKADLSVFQPILRRAVSKFYSYHGSLTTPPCNPVVTWMVSAREMPISGVFLKRLCTAVFEDGDGTKRMMNNFRPVQPQHGRIVTQHISIG